MPESSPTEIGYQKAIELLHRCCTPHGFVASPTEHANYLRVWARDGTIMGLAALMTGEHELIHTFRQTLLTLAASQGPHGEIPSNMDPVSQRVSYGGTTGRVDADLWFIIGCGEYWQATDDMNFLHQITPAIEKVRFLLGAWEFNNRGLIYVPQAGDWADEYLHAGYVLYDQLLYLQAQRTLCAIHAALQDTVDHSMQGGVARLKHLIQDNFWLSDDRPMPDDVYHEVLYEKGLNAEPACSSTYWLPFFSPTGYGYRFDAFGNILASLFDVANDDQRERVDTYIDTLVPPGLKLLPAFFPVIEPVDEDWKDLQMTFSYTFKNKPYEYHNGGLWPMLTGFYVADLAARQKMKQAQEYANAIHTANRMCMGDIDWSFPEFIHGKTLTPGGTPNLGWSAAAAIIAENALKGKRLLRIDGEYDRHPPL